MKINQEIRPVIEKRLGKGKLNTEKPSFQSVVQTETNKLKTEHIHQLLHAIDKQGERLSKSQSLKDLTDFKKLVKRFIKEAVDYGIEIEESRSWNFQGGRNVHKLIKQIDEELIALTDEVINEHSQTISILDRIGEVKGLLINLYM